MKDNISNNYKKKGSKAQLSIRKHIAEELTIEIKSKYPKKEKSIFYGDQLAKVLGIMKAEESRYFVQW